MLLLCAQYLAGLYDGEGTATIGFNRGGINKSYIHPHVQIGVAVDNKHAGVIISYLSDLGITSRVNHQKNLLGEAYQLIITGDGKTRFIDLILPHVIFKKERLRIIKQALELLTKYRGHTGAHYQEFNELRKAAHALAIKGPKTLKEYQ